MIREGVCVTAKAGFLAGLHRDSDDYMIALYGHDADIDPGTERYEPAGEVEGEGYEPGGKPVANWRVMVEDDAGVVDFDEVVWPVSSIEASGALIYNGSREDMPAIAVLEFGQSVRSTNGPFRVAPPRHLIRLR